jgi:hypothetical protein
MSEARAQLRGRLTASVLWRHRYALLHHALVAATLAALTLALHVSDAFKQVDILTQAFVTGVQVDQEEKMRERVAADMGFRLAPLHENRGDQPAVIVLPEPERQMSHRCATADEFYADVIEAVTAQRPGMLVLRVPGLDPALPVAVRGAEHCRRLPAGAYSDFQSPPFARGQFDADHERIVAAIRNAARNAPVVVSYHIPGDYTLPARDAAHEEHNEKVRRSLRWLAKICANENVSVGFPQHGNSAVYGRDIPLIGNLASAAYKSGGKLAANDRGLCGAVSGTSVPSTDDEYARMHRELDRLSRLQAKREGLVNARFRNALTNYLRLDARAVDPAAGLAPQLRTVIDGNVTRPLHLSGRPVFVGVDLLRMRFPFTDDDVAQVNLDGAIYYSNWVAPPERVVAVFLIDLVIGTLLGFIFTWSWGVHARATNAMYAVPATAVLTKLRALVWARVFVLGANLVLFGVLLVAIFWLAVELLWRGAWLNPLPLVAGMAIKGLLSSRQRQAGHVPQTFREFATDHPDVFWQPLVIAAAIAVALGAH